MDKFSSTIPSTMFDFAFYYDRVAELLPNECRIAEVGVADGASAIYLAEKLQEIGKGFTLYMIDSCEYGHQEQRNTIIRNIVGCGLGNKLVFMELDSLNASLKFPDGYFHFVFLDSGHTFELGKAEIRLWSRKVMDDWWLAGHDINTHKGVREAVEEVMPAGSYTVVPTADGHGIWTYKKDWQLVLK